MGMHVWNDETIAKLTKLWEEGFSASLIGEQMGITRNAVIGKVCRLGLPTPEGIKERKPHPLAGKGNGSRKPRVPKVKMLPRIKWTRESIRVVRANGNSDAMRLVKSVISNPPDLRCVEINPLHLSIYDLAATSCRHPYGDTAPFSFCGHRTLEGHSYCPDHKALNTEPTRHPLNVNRLAKVA
jgi:GcrA cell cycle regulator